MVYLSDYLIEAHKSSTSNKKVLQSSETCCCFYCLHVYAPSEVIAWIDEDGETALCPKCGVDAVIGSASGLPISESHFVEDMHKKYFLNLY